MYIEFETMQREIVIWLDNAEDILRELDKLKEDSEHSDDDINKFKVKYTGCFIFAFRLYAFLPQLKRKVWSTVN